jgi:hypothetical protein
MDRSAWRDGPCRAMLLAEQKKKNLWYFLIDINLNLELVQQKDIHRTNIDINKIYNNRKTCE